MFSHFESWDLEDIESWQDKENKSETKFESNFRPGSRHLFLHINVMKSHMSVRRPEEGGQAHFPQALGSRWRVEGAQLE